MIEVSNCICINVATMIVVINCICIEGCNND